MTTTENGKHYWLTPPEVYRELELAYGPFQFDPCPFPRPVDWDALTMEWGERSYLNPPYCKEDGGPSPFVHRAIEQFGLGHESTLIVPCPTIIGDLVKAGAQFRWHKRVKWLAIEDGEPQKTPGPIIIALLRKSGHTVGSRQE